MLDIAPTLEREFVERAQATGMSLDQYFARLLAAESAQDTPWRLPDLSHDQQQYARVLAYMNASDEEIAHLHAPEIARFDRELAEAGQATPEEVMAANAEWDEFKQRMNAHRAMVGEQALFADSLSSGGA